MTLPKFTARRVYEAITFACIFGIAATALASVIWGWTSNPSMSQSAQPPMPSAPHIGATNEDRN